MAQRVDADNLAENVALRQCLPITLIERVPDPLHRWRTAVTQGQVQESIRPEIQGTAVMVEVGLIHPEEFPGRVRPIDPQFALSVSNRAPFEQNVLGIRRPVRGIVQIHRAEIGDTFGTLGRVGIEQSVLLEIRMKRQPEQTALVIL